MATPCADTITLVHFNLKGDGGPDEADGTHPQPWRAAYHDLLPSFHADVICVGEMTHQNARQNAAPSVREAAEQRFQDAQEALGMRGFRAGYGKGRHPCGLFVRPQTFAVTRPSDEYDLFRDFRTPPAQVRLTLHDLPQAPIDVLSVHLAYNSPRARLQEAYDLTPLVDKLKVHLPSPPAGGLWIAGDFNELPLPTGEPTPPPDWDPMEDRVHRRHRAKRTPSGTWTAVTAVDELMHDIGMHDAARWAALRLGHPDALLPTAGHAARGQGGPRRIDRCAMDPWTVQAVIDVKVVKTELSDHHPVVITLSRPKLREALLRKTAPLQPWALVY